MYAPRAKFEQIYIVSPIKVAILFLTCLHCLCLLIAVLTSFWIETHYGHYGPLYSCIKNLNWKNSIISSITIQCHLGGLYYQNKFLWIPITAISIILSFLIAFISIITASLSLIHNTFSIRRRYWLCTIILLLFVSVIDSFILIFIPLSYRHQNYHLQWAYGLHCGATLFIAVSLSAAILTYNTDDIEYIETIDDSPIEK